MIITTNLHWRNEIFNSSLLSYITMNVWLLAEKCWMPLGKNQTIQLAPVIESTTFNHWYKCKRNSVCEHKFISLVSDFLFKLPYFFILHLLFALSDPSAEWFSKWIFEMLLIQGVITNYPSYCTFMSFLNGIPQPKLEKWLKTWNWTLMSSIPLCFLFRNRITCWIHLY